MAGRFRRHGPSLASIPVGFTSETADCPGRPAPPPRYRAAGRSRPGRQERLQAAANAVLRRVLRLPRGPLGVQAAEFHQLGGGGHPPQQPGTDIRRHRVGLRRTQRGGHRPEGGGVVAGGRQGRNSSGHRKRAARRRLVPTRRLASRGPRTSLRSSSRASSSPSSAGAAFQARAQAGASCWPQPCASWPHKKALRSAAVRTAPRVVSVSKPSLKAYAAAGKGRVSQLQQPADSCLRVPSCCARERAGSHARKVRPAWSATIPAERPTAPGTPRRPERNRGADCRWRGRRRRPRPCAA